MSELENDEDVMYVVFAEEPLEMEGADRFCAIFADKDLADEAAARWTIDAEIEQRRLSGDARWKLFASTYYVETEKISRTVGPLVH